MQLQHQFTEITALIASAKAKAYQAVNRELSKFIQETEPNITGFSPQNLWRMKQLYETYCQNEILSPLVREISWTNNLLILPCKSIEEKTFGSTGEYRKNVI